MKRCLLIVFLLVTLAPVCRGQEELWDRLGMDELSKAGERYDVGVELGRETELDHGLEQLLERATKYLPTAIRNGLSGAVSLLIVVIICAMAEGVRGVGTPVGELNVSILAGSLAITAVSADRVSTMMGLGRRTIEQMQGFSTVLLPISAACTAATLSICAIIGQTAALPFQTAERSPAPPSSAPPPERSG